MYNWLLVNEIIGAVIAKTATVSSSKMRIAVVAAGPYIGF
jgi:hypothetical protein